MARPITWQNVNSPQGALSIEAFLRSGRQAAEGFENMGNVFQKARDEIQQAATGAAVAQIANAQDPLAVAAQAPQTWQFDPLAIARAANARTEQIEAGETRDLLQKSTNLEMEETQFRLDDSRAKLQAEDLALPYRDLIFSGQKFEIDRTDPRWTTAAGKYALDRIDAWQNDYRIQKQGEEELALRREANRLAREDKAEQKKIQSAFNEITRYFGNEGAAKDPADQERWLTDYLTKQGLGYQLSNARALRDTTLQGNIPTDAERRRPNEYGVSAQDVYEVNAKREQVNQQQKNQKLAEYTDALSVGEELALNPYKEMRANYQSAWNLFQERNKDIGESIFTPRWDSDDFKQRTDKIIEYARKEHKIELPSEVAFQLVESSASALTPFDTLGVINKPVREGVARYAMLQSKGGLKQVQQEVANIEAEAAATTQILAKEVKAAELHARHGDKAPLPDSLIKAQKKDTGFRERALSHDITILRQQLEQQRKGEGNRFSRKSQQIAAELDRKIAELESL